MTEVLTRPARQAAVDFEAEAVQSPRARSLPVNNGDRVVYYEGDRIYFRPLEVEDEPRLRRWINNPVNWRTLLHRPPLNAVREREWVESLGKSTTDYVFGVVIKQGDRLIGTTGLHRVNAVNRSAVFGICIGDTAFQNRGYGREAVRLALRYGFEEINLYRVELDVFADNWRAIRTYQKAGFVYEGCFREAAFRGGVYQDIYRFSILQREWEARGEPDPLND